MEQLRRTLILVLQFEFHTIGFEAQFLPPFSSI